MVTRKNTYLLSMIYLVIMVLHGIGCRYKEVSFLASTPSDGDRLCNSPKGVVVLLHGLMAGPRELAAIHNSLLNCCDLQDILVVVPECRMGKPSLLLSLEKQTEKVFEEIRSKMEGHDLDVRHTPVVLFGYSQGGLVGLNLAKKYGSQFDLKAVVTMNTPITGVPLLETQWRTVRTRFDKMKSGLEVIRQNVAKEDRSTTSSCKGKKMSLHRLRTGICMMAKVSRSKWGMLGVRDMRCSSHFMDGIRQFLENKSANVPYLFIGSYVGSFDQLFQIPDRSDLRGNDSELIEELKDAYNTLVTNSEVGKHDTLIPLYSQLGHKATSFEDINRCIDEQMSEVNKPKNEGVRSISLSSPKYKNVTYKVYDGAIHTNNIAVLYRDLAIINPDIERVNCDNSVIQDLLMFICGKILDHGSTSFRT